MSFFKKYIDNIYKDFIILYEDISVRNIPGYNSYRFEVQMEKMPEYLTRLDVFILAKPFSEYEHTVLLHAHIKSRTENRVYGIADIPDNYKIIFNNGMKMWKDTQIKYTDLDKNYAMCIVHDKEDQPFKL